MAAPRRIRCLLVLLAAVLAVRARGDVTYDESSRAEAPLHAGNIWVIGEDHGVQRGGNLFHGLARFDLAPGERALFLPTSPVLRDPGLPPIRHVIARVSGGVPSSIRGTIRSEHAADLYLLNPAGLIFGPGAALDVQGVFVASTADVLRVGDEPIEVFLDRADPFPLLAIGPPSAFGFLGTDPPATIRIADAKLGYARSSGALALFGGALEVERGLVSSVANDLFVAAVRAGEIRIRPEPDPLRFDFSGVTSGGSILLREAALSSSGIEPLGEGRWPDGTPRKVPGAGNVFIHAGDLLGIDANVLASTTGELDGGDIDIALDGRLELERRSFSGVGIFSFSQLPDPLVPRGAGSSGDVRIGARELSLQGGARISAGAFGAGAAGRIEIDVDERVSISGRDISTDPENPDESGLFVTTRGGPAGSIELRARDLVMDDFGVIVGETRSDETGGAIDLEVERLEITGNARIDSSTRGPGDAGNIDVLARESIHISGSESAEEFSGITAFAQAESTGAPGSIHIETPSLVVENGGQIATSALGGLSGNEQQDALRGDVTVDLEGDGRLALRSGGTLSVRSDGPRDAGNISVRGAASIELSGGSSISSDAEEASDGGSITLEARDELSVRDSEIIASVDGGTGGNVTIDPEFVILQNGRIVAGAETGTGGNIDISAGLFVADANSLVDASSRLGIDGTVIIRSPDVDLSRNLAALPDSFVDPADLLADPCAARENRANGSLKLRAFDSLPDWPGRLRPARYAPELAAAADPDLKDLWTAARAAEQRGAHELALDRWEQAHALATTPALRAAAKLGSAQALERSGRSEHARGAIEAAVAESASLPNAVAGAAYAIRGRLRAASGEWPAAETDFERALEHAARAHDAALQAHVQSDLGVAQLQGGQRERALHSLDEAGRHAAQAGDAALRAVVRANRTTLLLEASDPAQAQTALAGLQDERSGATENHDGAFAALHALLGELTLGPATPATLAWLEAIAAAAARRGDPRAESFARGISAHRLASTGQTEAAVAGARRALELAQQARAPEAELLWARLLGRELAALGRSAAAVRVLESAYALRADSFAGIPDAATASPIHASWFSTPALLDELVDQLLHQAAIREDPAERERLLLAARGHLDDHTALDLREYFADECVATQRVASAALLPGAVVVYPVLLRDRVELIVSSALGIRSVLVDATPDQITREARQLAELAQERTSRRYREPAARLYDWLIRPLAADLGSDGERTLVIVPRGALLRVPWAALYDAQRRSHLIEHHPLAILPGLSLAESRPLSGDVSALKAGLSEAVQGLPGLPAVARELGAIGSSYHGPVLLDAGFTASRLEAALRSEPYGVLHIASHASFGASARDAYVVTFDGRIGAQQLAELVELTRYRDQPLELLTLSACDTSVGDERAALGLAGLSVRSGARSTLGTLWPVNDEATAELIGHFYRELARPGAGRAEALRRAQQATLAQSRLAHPAYWSPFLMIGSWQ